ncbi:MAG: zinc-binding dehydrogenase [Bacteroidales bacterium]|nr:zinc-binding dehydrogenase [Candidatus Colimorpha merdihippi]MCQ2274994.1 zinc-binding dehydrogenase [Bacteroidales bacterium]MCQ2281063.1 zinc-binding dehydrogenase [Bacteroidales bacterium]
MQPKGNKFGTHRVIEPKGVLPQPANKLDNNMDVLYDNEILIDVQTLNIDSASFTDIHNYAKAQAGEGATEAQIMEEVKKEMLLNVELQGKHRNRRTGSGGMLLGKVEKIGDALKGKIDLKEGDRIATLVSLSLTPLRIDEIMEIRPEIDQVDIKGKAILFESGIYAKIPTDMPEKLALSALDVAGAPAQTARLCQYGQTVVIMGAGGKSGMLCAYEAKKRVGVTGKVIGLANSPKSTQRIKDLGFCDVVESVAGKTPVEVYELVEKLTNGKMADVTINCVNVPDQEMTAVLVTKDDGTVYFFSMATSFTKASLGAEGIGMDVNMIMGNGYTKGHAEFTLQELRESPELRKIFEELYA